MATLAFDSNRTEAPLKIRINRRGWAVLVGIPVFALTIVAAFLFTMFTSSAQASDRLPSGVETVSVNVIAGDTLWGLAKEYSAGYDISDAMDHISEINALDSHQIHVGDVLEIPVLSN